MKGFYRNSFRNACISEDRKDYFDEIYNDPQQLRRLRKFAESKFPAGTLFLNIGKLRFGGPIRSLWPRQFHKLLSESQVVQGKSMIEQVRRLDARLEE